MTDIMFIKGQRVEHNRPGKALDLLLNTLRATNQLTANTNFPGANPKRQAAGAGPQPKSPTQPRPAPALKILQGGKP